MNVYWTWITVTIKQLRVITSLEVLAVFVWMAIIVSVEGSVNVSASWIPSISLFTIFIMMHITELNECSDPSLNDCDVNADCTDIPGSYKCNCRPGYSGNGTFCDSMVECVCVCCVLIIVVCISDVDECQNDTLNNCNVNADCFDTEGSFNCTCRAGYTGTGIQCQGK